MKRDEEFKSPSGQAAWNYYQLWMRQMKRLSPPAGSFLTSKYFRTFINFTKFIKSVDLPKPDKFIWLMVEKKYPPTMWMSDEVYSMYLEYLDRKSTPIEQLKLSVDTLLRIADKHNIDVCDVFTVLAPSDIIHLLRVRQISPWLLLRSKKFKKMLVEQTNPEQKIMLESLIQPTYWTEKLTSSPNELAIIDNCVNELDI